MNAIMRQNQKSTKASFITCGGWEGGALQEAACIELFHLLVSYPPPPLQNKRMYTACYRELVEQTGTAHACILLGDAYMNVQVRGVYGGVHGVHTEV